MTDRLMLRPAEVGDAIGVSRSKAYELIAAGEIPSVKVGGCVRVPIDALKAWISAAQVKGSPGATLPSPGVPGETPGRGRGTGITLSPSRRRRSATSTVMRAAAPIEQWRRRLSRLSSRLANWLFEGRTESATVARLHRLIAQDAADNEVSR